MTRKIGITDTVLRDGHQSLLATRMKTEDMLPIAEKLDKVGYWSVEMWGGATFDTCLRYLKEDPWQRLKKLKQSMPHTKMQMLLRGQNIVGYRHYPDDVVEAFVDHAHSNGIDVFRIFDALNDVRNMETAIKAAKKTGAHVEGSFCFTTSPVHTIQMFVRLAKDLEALDCDSVCIKDMAGILPPEVAYRLVKELKENISVPIHLHTHCTSGMAVATTLKAVEAGVDLVDTAISSFSMGTSHPPTETIVAMLKEPGEPAMLDLALLTQIADYFRDVRRKYREFEMDYFVVDANSLAFQIPGGMLSNLSRQLKDQNALNRMPEVLEEVPKVRAELGYPPLVTPTSQIVGTQAALNVLLGERYKMIPMETKNLVRGLYGKSAAPIDPEVKKKAIGDEEPIESRPADLLKPELEKAKADSALMARGMEDVISWALFPQVAKEYFEERDGLRAIPEESIAALAVALFQTPPTQILTQSVMSQSTGRTSPWKLVARQEGIRHGRSGGRL
jgi:oxaloacetate decarboxylase alpha subunit